MDLLIELKIAIASINEQAWINLYITDPVFAQYAQTYAAKHLFIALFTKIETIPYYSYSHSLTTTKLFGKLHSIYDNPAEIELGKHPYKCETWYYQGLIHRNHKNAVIFIGYSKSMFMSWYSFGKRIPRINGEANYIERCNSLLIECWYDGDKLMQETHNGVIIN